MDPDLGQRLKAYRLKANVSMTEISVETGISRENLYKWERGSKPSNIRDYTALKNYLDKKESTENATESNPDQAQIKPATLYLPFDAGSTAVGQFNAQSAAGTVMITDDQQGLIVDRIDAPFLGDAEGAVEITEESMAPTIKSGYRVAIARLKDTRLLNWGTIYYIVDRNWHGMVRRIYPASESDIRLMADHVDQSKYPPILRLWNDITAIFRVKAVIQRL